MRVCVPVCVCVVVVVVAQKDVYRTVGKKITFVRRTIILYQNKQTTKKQATRSAPIHAQATPVRDANPGDANSCLHRLVPRTPQPITAMPSIGLAANAVHVEMEPHSTASKTKHNDSFLMVVVAIRSLFLWTIFLVVVQPGSN